MPHEILSEKLYTRATQEKKQNPSAFTDTKSTKRFIEKVRFDVCVCVRCREAFGSLSLYDNCRHRSRVPQNMERCSVVLHSKHVETQGGYSRTHRKRH